MEMNSSIVAHFQDLYKKGLVFGALYTERRKRGLLLGEGECYGIPSLASLCHKEILIFCSYQW